MQPLDTRLSPAPAYAQLSRIGYTPALYATSAVYTQPSDTELAHVIKILLSAIHPPAAITTTSTGHVFLVDPPPVTTIASTGHTPTSSLGPSAVTTLLIPAPFAELSASSTSPGKAPINTSSASPTPAPVDASTILPSITTLLLPAIPQTGTRPVSALNPPSAINLLAAMTNPNTNHGKKLSNLAEIYTDEVKYSSQNDSSIFKLANLWKNALRNLSKNF